MKEQISIFLEGADKMKQLSFSFVKGSFENVGKLDTLNELKAKKKIEAMMKETKKALKSIDEEVSNGRRDGPTDGRTVL